MRHFGRKLAGGSALALTAGLMAGAAQADIVHADDVIINRYSLCVGGDCADGYNFGSDTIVMRENNTRLFFDDTSNSGSFPNVDWRLIANDDSNGGRNIFILQDATNNKQPFAVEANSPNNTLYVASEGRIGVRTDAPVLDVHIKQGNTPGVRLEQDTSSGFNAQIWDVAGNETNFFIRDVTHSSKLPFRLLPNAPANALYVAADGDVGLGTASPDADLDIEGASPFMRLTDTGGADWDFKADSDQAIIDTGGGAPEFALETNGTLTIPGPMTLEKNGVVFTSLVDTSTGVTWNVQNQASEARITTQAGAGIEFALATNGNLTITGEIFTAGSCSGGCDRVFEPDYDLRSIQEHAKLMWTNGYLPAVGATPEEGSMNLSQKVGGMLNELEHAHIYIAQLDEQVRKNALLEERVALLEGRLASIE